MKVHLILPAFNEADSLPKLLERIAQTDSSSPWPITAWVIDDGSTDGTLDIATKGVAGLDLKVLSHLENQGLGQAVLTGIEGVLGVASDRDILVVMDADDTHDPNLIYEFVSRIEDGADIVIASRFVSNGNDQTAPAFRRLLSRCASVVFRIAFPLEGIRDFTSGFRAYRVANLHRAYHHWGERLIVERSFACMVELLVKLRHFAPRIEEVPLVLRYDRKRGPSKLKITSTISQYLRLALKDRLGPAPRLVELQEAIVASTKKAKHP